MRPLTVVAFVLTALALAAAAFLGAPYWLAALYAVPLFGTFAALGLALCLLELLLGPRIRTAAVGLAAALALFAGLYAIFEGAPGTFPASDLPMRGLGEKALSVAALGCGLGGLALGAWGLRAPGRAAQLLALLALSGSTLAVGTLPAALGLPHFAPWALGVLAAGGGLFVLSAARDGGQPDDAGSPDGPPPSEQA